MTVRYGQLSYTSFDTVGSAGGWQVKETAGGITPDESALLVAGVHTALNPVEPLPPYPTPDQVQALPHRLAYRRLDGSRAGYWHTVPAGSDATGRPGNVFAHMLLDRDAARPTPRPVELWRSPRWLTPFGAPAVTSAALPGAVPGAGDVVSVDSVVDFVCDTGTWRLGTLCGLLDAVAAALSGGPPVVLGVDSVDVAAQWIGAVSYLMSPGTARRLNFSTFDRIGDLEHSLRIGQHLIAMPRADLGGVGRDVVVVDETATLSLGELGGQPHRTAGGQNIAVTAWSAMAQVTMVDPASAAQILTDIDGFASRIVDADLAPALPMAIAVLNRAEWADAVAEARMVIGAGTPPARLADPGIVGIVDDEVRRLVGTSTAQAWQVAEHGAGLVGDAARAVYISRAIRDDAWLSGPGLIPAPAQPFSPDTVPDTLIVDVVEMLDAVDSRDPGLVLRAIDLLVRSGVGEDVDPVIERKIVPALLDPVQAAPLVTRLRGRVSRDTRLLVAAAALVRLESGVLGQSLLRWLADDVVAPRPEELAVAEPGDPVWTAASLRGMSAAESGAPQPAERYLALWWLRRRDVPLRQCEYVFGFGPWNPAELLLAVGDGPLPAGPTVITLLGAADSTGMQALADRVLADNADDTAVACAALRGFEPGDWISTGYLHTHFGAYTPYWDALIREIGRAAVHHDFAVRLLVLATLGLAGGAPQPDACRMLADETIAGEVVYRIESLVMSGTADAELLIAGALLAAEPAGGAQPILQQVAARLAASRDPSDVDGIVDKMAQLTGAVSDGDVRRLRRVASKQLADWQAEAAGHPARMWSR